MYTFHMSSSALDRESKYTLCRSTAMDCCLHQKGMTNTYSRFLKQNPVYKVNA